MAASTAIIGTLASISGAGITGDILSFNGPNMSRPEIDMTHMASPTVGATDRWREKIPGSFADGGQVSVSVAFAPGSGFPSLGGQPSEYVITWRNPDGTTVGTCTFDGFVANFSFTNNLEERVTADITVEVTGVPVFAAGGA